MSGLTPALTGLSFGSGERRDFAKIRSGLRLVRGKNARRLNKPLCRIGLDQSNQKIISGLWIEIFLHRLRHIAMCPLKKEGNITILESFTRLFGVLFNNLGENHVYKLCYNNQ